VSFDGLAGLVDGWFQQDFEGVVPINKLDTRAENCIHNLGCEIEPRAVSALSKLDLIRGGNCGRKTLSRIEHWLADHGFKLSPHDFSKDKMLDRKFINVSPKEIEAEISRLRAEGYLL
jgi:hypothetical protein